jgi:NADH-quinone oxidoreductase subunit M
MLWMFQRVNYGEVTNEKNRNLPDLSPREWALMIPTVALCIFMGVFPGVFLKPMEPSIIRTLDRINGLRIAGGPATRGPDLQVGRDSVTRVADAKTPDLKVGPTGGGGR